MEIQVLISKNLQKNTKRLTRYINIKYKIGLNKEGIDFEKVKKAHLLVIAGPKEQFAPNEIADMKKLIESGGKLLVLANEGGDRK